MGEIIVETTHQILSDDLVVVLGVNAMHKVFRSHTIKDVETICWVVGSGSWPKSGKGRADANARVRTFRTKTCFPRIHVFPISVRCDGTGRHG